MNGNQHIYNAPDILEGVRTPKNIMVQSQPLGTQRLAALLPQSAPTMVSGMLIIGSRGEKHVLFMLFI